MIAATIKKQYNVNRPTQMSVAIKREIQASARPGVSKCTVKDIWDIGLALQMRHGFKPNQSMQ